MAIKSTPKQKEAIKLMADNRTTLLEGGSRSGKTFIILYTISIRSLHYPGTQHLAARLRLNHAVRSIWLDTLPKVLKVMGLYNFMKFDNKDYYAEFPNGSRIWIDGLDDKDRVEKILGTEYATLYFNEASQIPYDTFDLVSTRLNPPKNVIGRKFIDYNPPNVNHWGYKIFHKREFPDGRKVADGDYAYLKINPEDNKDNISDDYIEKTLMNLSPGKRKRFLLGEYGSDEGTLWQRSWFKYGKPPSNLIRVVIGVDPSGSTTGDEVGIVVAGIAEDGKRWVLGDYTLNASPKEWGDEVARVYTRHVADCVAAEKNFGGDMVEATITQFGKRDVNVKLVNASRGKAVRAEPISAMYERGEVIHAEQLLELEDELCSWKPGDDTMKSPNRMDALVWALSELSNDESLDYV